MQELNAEEALDKFLSATLKKRNGRYCDLISRPKGRKKFLGELYHQLGDCFREDAKVAELSNDHISWSAYSFSECRGFGTVEISMASGLEALINETGWLLISQNGKCGIYQPEDMIDDRLHIVA